MDKELYKKLLSEVADWHIPKLTETEKKQSRGRGRPTSEELYEEARQKIIIEEFDGINPTVPVEMLNIKKKAVICEDCGKECPNGYHKEKKLYDTNGKKNWREKCITCNMSQDPYTGKFTLNNSKASAIWNSYLRDVSRRNYTEKVEESEGTITIYPESKKD